MMRWVAGLCAVLLSVAAARADDAGNEFFEKRVRPILVDQCYKCHGPEKQKGELRLDSRDAALKGGETGPALVPADPKKSRLVEAVSYANVELQMPPKKKLSDQEIADLAKWVEMGAPWPGGEKVIGAKVEAFDLEKRKREHWAWQHVREHAIPAVKQGGWVKDPIDAFVLAKLEAKGLSPAEPADRRTLIRRLSFDLLGLPPTPAEVEAYLKDESPQATERVVDRLLASPHFGERWGRHWLDLVRYAETYGHEFDYPIMHAWKYRDWVIRALNADVPYDRFVTEQIAGDLLEKPRLHPAVRFNESIIGTGFWFFGEQVHAPVDVRQHQAERIDNQVDVLGKTFLAVTLSCARCHDHKFDAISQRDVYAMWGFAESTRIQEAMIDVDGRIAAGARQLGDLRRRGDEALGFVKTERVSSSGPDGGVFEDFSSLKNWYRTGEAFETTPAWEGQFEPVTGGRLAADGGVAHSGMLDKRLRGVLRSRTFPINSDRIYYRVKGKKAVVRVVVNGYIMDQFSPLLFKGLIAKIDNDQWHWHTVGGDLNRYKGHRTYIEIEDDGAESWIAVDEIRFTPPPKREAASSAVPPEQAKPLAAITAEMDKLGATIPQPMKVLAAAEGDGLDTPLYIRGNPKTLGDVAQRKFLTAISGELQPPIGGGSGRLELARRIVDPSNPLTARVRVNRIWHHLIGRGLVASTDNFGVLGSPPTHPELLDHLADRFMKDGWSTKRMIRSIVLSATYQQSSVSGDARAKDVDPENLLLHRMNMKRLEGEAIRDAMLLVSGRLNRTMFGEPVHVHLTSFMDGRGRPPSGPLDGDGRRSVYLSVRRNFLSPMMLAFDTPIPFNTMGRRAVSNVPAQALMLMNDPFVVQQAQLWARRVMKQQGTEARIMSIYHAAFGRSPEAQEFEAAKTFLDTQMTTHDAKLDDDRVWADLCHVMFNVKEFVFVR